jgi:hypothetical protein
MVEKGYCPDFTPFYPTDSENRLPAPGWAALLLLSMAMSACAAKRIVGAANG